MRFAACKEIPFRTGKKVAIIGAGPAGLKAAGYLICKGHNVVVYDKLPAPGGLLIFGIPEWRMPKEPIKKGINELKELGVKFVTNTEIGKDITFDEIVSEYDAVIIATGTWKEKDLRIEGENLIGVYGALDFLVKLALYREGYIKDLDINLGKKAVVIGGGNSAMDAARTLIRMNIETIVAYRRTKEYMPAYEHEVKKAEEEGVKFMFLVSPRRILGSNGKVVGIELIKNRLGEIDSTGRPRPEPIPGSEFTIECDMVIKAIGEIPTPPKDLISKGLKVDKRGRIIVDERGMTSIEGVFAAGDVVLGPSEIGKALIHGLEVAKNVDLYLREK